VLEEPTLTGVHGGVGVIAVQLRLTIKIMSKRQKRTTYSGREKKEIYNVSRKKNLQV
jgi:hypothetical protein